MLNYLVDCVAQLAHRRSLAGKLTLFCARPAADGWPLCGYSKPSATGQPTRPTQPFILPGL